MVMMEFTLHSLAEKHWNTKGFSRHEKVIIINDLHPTELLSQDPFTSCWILSSWAWTLPRVAQLLPISFWKPFRGGWQKKKNLQFQCLLLWLTLANIKDRVGYCFSIISRLYYLFDCAKGRKGYQEALQITPVIIFTHPVNTVVNYGSYFLIELFLLIFRVKHVVYSVMVTCHLSFIKEIFGTLKVTYPIWIMEEFKDRIVLSVSV